MKQSPQSPEISLPRVPGQDGGTEVRFLSKGTKNCCRKSGGKDDWARSFEPMSKMKEGSAQDSKQGCTYSPRMDIEETSIKLISSSFVTVGSLPSSCPSQ